MKYLFIDTNIYITCCLLELEGDNLGTLKQLHELLDKEKVKLLFPEVVLLELKKVLNEKTTKIESEVGKVREFTKTNTSLNSKIRADIEIKMTECIEERKSNSDKVKKEINAIFSSPNTIKELYITDSDIISAYKMFLSGVKPYKKTQGEIQPDCLIISALERFFANKKSYELLFCSANTSDFAIRTESSEFAIHPDIKEKFSTITYFENLFTLLNTEFNAKYPDESIEEFSDKAEEVSEEQDIDTESTSQNNNETKILGSYDVLRNIAKMYDANLPMRRALKEIAELNNIIDLSDFKKNLNNICSIRSQVLYQSLAPTEKMLGEFRQSVVNIMPSIEFTPTIFSKIDARRK